MFLIALFIVSFVAVALLSQPDLPKVEAEEVERPITEEGKILGVVLGTHWVDNPVVLRWGEVYWTEIKQDGGK